MSCKTPCADCPFSRAVKPGHLGGSPAEMYIGQAHGPFVLPCHNYVDFEDEEWKDKVMDTPQCAGAAIFRTHLGVAGLLPKAIHKLPASPKVFISSAEFMAHHIQIPIWQAQQLLIHTPEHVLLDRELRKAEVRRLK